MDGEVVEVSQTGHYTQRLGAGGRGGVKVLRAVEGTVILHINSAVKHDPLLAKDLVRVLRFSSSVCVSMRAWLCVCVGRCVCVFVVRA